MNKCISNRLGYSLIELMISLALAAMIMLGFFYQIDIAQNQAKKISEQLFEDLEEEYLFEFFRYSIRQAGFTPCHFLKNLEVKDKRAPHLIPRAIEIKQEGKQLILRKMSHDFSFLERIHHPQEILIDSEKRFQPHQSIMIANCQLAELHRIQEVSQYQQHQLLKLETPISPALEKQIYLGEWIEERFEADEHLGLSVRYGENRGDILSSDVNRVWVNIEHNGNHEYVVVQFNFKNGQVKTMNARSRNI